tara:strand:- start:316 stop:930 length:615 start_codon:yes stop_codon:yes gene_type:complete
MSNHATAWNNEEISDHMMQTNFPHLQISNHFAPLKLCVDFVVLNCKNVLDIGCGKAEFATAFPNFDYTGADLEHVIENVSKKTSPQLNYVVFDAQKDDYGFISQFDLIIMNSFLSEMPNGIEVLDKVLQNVSDYIIIHRQELHSTEDYLTEYKTYGGLPTVNYTMSKTTLDHLLKKNNCTLLINVESFPNDKKRRTLLIKKNDQ